MPSDVFSGLFSVRLFAYDLQSARGFSSPAPTGHIGIIGRADPVGKGSPRKGSFLCNRLKHLVYPEKKKKFLSGDFLFILPVLFISTVLCIFFYCLTVFFKPDLNFLFFIDHRDFQQSLTGIFGSS